MADNYPLNGKMALKARGVEMSDRFLRWICLDVGILDNSKIRIIRNLPDGAKLIVVWIGLLTLAAKHGGDGLIMISRDLPLNPETLALLLGESAPVVSLALKTFQGLNMIELREANTICITGWQEHQHIEALERSRERKRLRDERYRDKQRRLLLPDSSGAQSADLPPDPAAGVVPELVEKWRPAFDALAATGKMPALTIEHLVLVDRAYPRARLSENFSEIVSEVRGVNGVVGSTMPWLRKTVGALEHQIIQAEAERQAVSTEDKF